MTEKYFDVQDEEGVWRVGICYFIDQTDTKTIGLDGFHPNFTTVSLF